MLRLLAIVGLMGLGVLRAPAEPDVVTIVDSGSTNRAGFRIVVDREGVAHMTSMPRRSRAPQEQSESVERVLSPVLVKRFRADLEAAQPLAALPEVRCMKSVSFGSRLNIAFGGEQTPDLRCGDGGNAVLRNLIRDADEIVALFHDK
jgi:hypothetical protein